MDESQSRLELKHSGLVDTLNNNKKMEPNWAHPWINADGGPQTAHRGTTTVIQEQRSPLEKDPWKRDENPGGGHGWIDGWQNCCLIEVNGNTRCRPYVLTKHQEEKQAGTHGNWIVVTCVAKWKNSKTSLFLHRLNAEGTAHKHAFCVTSAWQFSITFSTEKVFFWKAAFKC